jgi:thiamine transport system permease protein
VRRPSLSLLVGLGAAVVPLAVVVVFFVVPLVGMVQRGFFVDGELDLAGVAAELSRPRVAQVLWFTVWTAGLATAVTLLLGVPTAYALYRLDLPGAAVLRGLVTVPFVLPTVVVGVAFRTLLAPNGPLGGLGLDGTPAAIVAALVFFNLSVVVRVVGPWWGSLDPRREQAAAALGASPAQVFRTVTLPALRPALVSAASVVFLFCATGFGVVLVLGGTRYSTVETEIYLLTTQFLDLRAAAALSVLQVLVVVVLLVLAGRVQPRGGGAVDRAVVTTTRRPRGAFDGIALALTGACLVLVVLPMVTVVARSLRLDGSWTLQRYQALGDTSEGAVVRTSVLDAAAMSLRVAVDATLLAVVLGAVVAVLVTRRMANPGLRRTARAFDGLFMLPLGVSAVTVGFGLLVALDSPPLDFRGSPWLLPVAQALVALPLVVRTLVPVLRGVDERLREAAATLGASPLRIVWDIDLTTAWRSVLAAAGFAFAVSLGEFGATSFLARPDEPTLSVLVYQLIGRPGGDSFGTALAAAVLLGAMTAAVLMVVERLRVGRLGVF